LEEKTPLVETAVVWRQEDMTPVLREFLQIVRSVCGELIS
ncbi:LysR family transcriptional regulator, partial [Nostoc sp. UCD120]|nr:LysR family transcriptional regulator [Nostoc sp. UCD120]